MDKMNLIDVLIVSIPEFIFDIFIGFLLIGEKRKILLNDYRNIIKLCLSITLMAIFNFILRIFTLNVGIMLLLDIMAYTVIIKFTYNIKIFKSFISTLYFMVILVSIELLYIPSCIAFLNNYEEMFSDNLLRFLYVVPERIIQLAIVISLWNWDVILINLNKYKKIKSIATITFIVVAFSEMIIAYVFANSFSKYDLTYKILMMIGCAMLVIGNALIFKLITLVTKTIRFEEANRHKNQLTKVMNVVYTLFGKNSSKNNKDIVNK